MIITIIIAMISQKSEPTSLITNNNYDNKTPVCQLKRNRHECMKHILIEAKGAENTQE